MSCSWAPSLILQVGPTRVLGLRQPRWEHERKYPIPYLGIWIDTQSAISELKHLSAPDSNEPRLSCQYLNYAMCMMQNAITEDDEYEACKLERENEELVLSDHTGLSGIEHLGPELRSGIHDFFRQNLKGTEEGHLKEANNAGFSGFTVEILRALRYHLQNLKEEEMNLLMYVTWSRSTPQLARGLELVQDN